MNYICPNCENKENFHFNYDWSKQTRPIIDIMCNECGEIFDDPNEIYRKIEQLIISWSNDGTKTAGTLTREIIDIINKKI